MADPIMDESETPSVIQRVTSRQPEVSRSPRSADFLETTATIENKVEVQDSTENQGLGHKKRRHSFATLCHSSHNLVNTTAKKAGLLICTGPHTYESDSDVENLTHRHSNDNFLSSFTNNPNIQHHRRKMALGGDQPLIDLSYDENEGGETHGVGGNNHSSDSDDDWRHYRGPRGDKKSKPGLAKKSMTGLRNMFSKPNLARSAASGPSTPTRKEKRATQYGSKYEELTVSGPQPVNDADMLNDPKLRMTDEQIAIKKAMLGMGKKTTIGQSSANRATVHGGLSGEAIGYPSSSGEATIFPVRHSSLIPTAVGVASAVQAAKAKETEKTEFTIPRKPVGEGPKFGPRNRPDREWIHEHMNPLGSHGNTMQFAKPSEADLARIHETIGPDAVKKIYGPGGKPAMTTHAGNIGGSSSSGPSMTIHKQQAEHEGARIQTKGHPDGPKKVTFEPSPGTDSDEDIKPIQKHASYDESSDDDGTHGVSSAHRKGHQQKPSISSTLNNECNALEAQIRQLQAGENIVPIHHWETQEARMSINKSATTPQLRATTPVHHNAPETFGLTPKHGLGSRLRKAVSRVFHKNIKKDDEEVGVTRQVLLPSGNTGGGQHEVTDSAEPTSRARIEGYPK